MQSDHIDGLGVKTDKWGPIPNNKHTIANLTLLIFYFLRTNNKKKVKATIINRVVSEVGPFHECPLSQGNL